ncbi:MAG: family 2 glycosyl transferase [Microgenomates group bacterium Gr01-1014_16]|nr:MAG: family 2 glycosyl transferase [Microgenomates group bacterium Gr01-1014_16]
MQKPYLSVVIPAYNEAVNFRNGVLNEPLEYLRMQKYTWEMIFVDDGSTDDTYKLLSGLTTKNIRVLQIPHGGKAAAVTAGVLAAKGDYILFTDFDQSTPIDQVEKFLSAHKSGEDIVTGVRVKTEQDTLFRKIRSWAYVTLVQLIVLPELKDSQCGFKSFTNPAAKKIFGNLLISLPTGEIKGPYMGAWEVEVFFLAKKFGFKIDQVPVRWIKYLSDRLNPWRDPLYMFRDTLKVRLYDILGKYDQV